MLVRYTSLARHPPHAVPLGGRRVFQELVASREEDAAEGVGLGAGEEGVSRLGELALAVGFVAGEEQLLLGGGLVGGVAEEFVDADGRVLPFTRTWSTSRT